MAAKPRRRRRRSARRRPVSRRRRRNAGITPFVSNPVRRRRRRRSNPLILSNPRRRRRSGGGRITAKHVIDKVLTFGGGGALAYATNQFALRNVQHDWTRRALQAGTAVLGSIFLRGEMGAAFAGGMMYPLMGDLALLLGVVTAQDYDINELSADLNNAMGGALSADLNDVDELLIDDGLDVW